MSKQSQTNFHTHSDKNLGEINITTSVLESIAAKAATNVPGVVTDETKTQFQLGNIIRVEREAVKTKASRNDNGEMVIDVSLFIRYGYSIPEVALLVQTAVKEEILFMTNLVVSQVNVHVQAVETDTNRHTDYYHINGDERE